jgi:hypothetical protein
MPRTDTTTRRTFVASTLGAGLALGASLRTPQLAAQEAGLESAGLGLVREEFEALVGPGTDEGEIVRYADPNRDGGRISVAYRDGRVAHLELDATGTAAGGFADDNDARAAIAAYAPADSTETGVYQLGFMSMQGNYFATTTAESTGLAGALGNAGMYVSIIERPPMGDTGEAGPSLPLRATISAETDEGVAVTPTGNPGGLGPTRSHWEAAYGESQVTQRGTRFDVPPFEEALVLVALEDNAIIVRIEALTESGIGIDDAAAFIGSWLPADAVQLASFYTPSTPEGPIALRVQHWDLPTLGAPAVVILYEDGPEESASVTRILMALKEMQGLPDTVEAAATPEA